MPQSYLIGGVQLGVWVNNQRRLYKKGKLPANRREMLDALGLSWDALDHRRERNFALLKQFLERVGHGNVPRSHKEDGVKLGNWLHEQRKLYKKGKLDKSCQRRLDNLGVSWDPHAEQWEHNFALLEQYQNREDHSNVPREHKEDEVKLGRWLNNQRTLYKKGKLDESRQRRLENLGVSWEPLADQWEQNFALFKQFQEREGHSNVPDVHEEDGVQLGEWLKRQRQQYKKGKLDDSYEQRLESAGISWDPHADQWERNFSTLVQYKEREGHCNVPFSHEEDGIKLGAWLYKQRLIRRNDSLRADRIKRLDKLGIRWSFISPNMCWRYKSFATPKKRRPRKRRHWQ